MTNPLHTCLKSALKALTPPELVKSYGRLTRVNGLTLTATGGQFAMGEKYQVESVDGHWYDAEVVGFNQDEAYLMPLKKIQNLYSGGRVRPVIKNSHVAISEKLLGRVLHAIAGTSMGAVIGGLYASGYSADELEKLALSLDWQNTLGDSPRREDIPYRRKQDDRDFLVKQRLSFNNGVLSFPLGLMQGQNMGVVLESLLVHTNEIDDFDKLPIPFRAVVTAIRYSQV